MAERKLCAVDGCCNGGKITRGFCDKHYKRWRKHGDPLVTLYDRAQSGRPCKHPGCEKQSGYKGFCQNHYKMARLAPLRAARAARHAAINELTDAEAAYIAGMVDADGMVTAAVRPGWATPMVCVTNSNFALLDWLDRVIGAGCAYRQHAVAQRPDQDRSRWNEVHRYQLTGRKAQSLLLRIAPFMLVKRRQADLVMKLPQRGKDFSCHAAREHRDAAARIVAEIRTLNARGRKSDDHIGVSSS